MDPYVLILIFILGSLIGIPIAYLIFRKKIKLPQIKYNQQIQQLNDELQQNNQALLNQKTEITNKLIELDNLLLNKKQEIKNASFQLEETKAEASKIKDEFLKTNLESAQMALDQSLEKIAIKYQQAEDDYINEYLMTIAEMTKSAQEELSKKQEESQNLLKYISNLKLQISDLRVVIDTITESQKRAQAEIEQKDFYRLNLSQEDKEEIEILRTITHKLRDPSTLNKVIWKVYYEKPYSALVGRVLGQNNKCGIYKITNLKNGMTYVGQSVNVADRWRQHIKRGIGAESPTRNKLYPAMLEYGVENFMFELLEECPAQKLNEKEDYYQEVFHCKDYGYSIK